MLNDKQKLAVETTEGPVLIIAGAGTGKTHTLTERVSHIIKQGGDPKRILLMTFTNKAADEMKERIIGKVGSQGSEIIASTYHSFAVRILRQYAKLVGLENNFTIMDESSRRSSLNLIMSREFNHLNEDIDRIKPDQIIRMYSEIINKSIFPGIENYEKVIEEAMYEYLKENHYGAEKLASDYAKLFLSFQKHKLERNTIDYDDIIYLVNFMLSNNRDVALRLSEYYQYKMVDEFQDSNHSQLLFIRNLTRGGNDNIAVVGDDQQSIYAFRGANFKNIIDFPKMFKGTEVIILDKNYRSTQEILDLSNEVVKSAPEKFDKELNSTKGNGEKPKVVKFDTIYDEAEFVIDKILEHHYNDKIPFSEMAIIQRSSSHGYSIEQALKQANIDYDVYGGMKFFDRPLVKLFISYTKIMENKYDEVAWYEILGTYPNIGGHYASRIAHDIYSGKFDSLSKPQKAKYTRRLPELHHVYNYVENIDFEDFVHFMLEYKGEDVILAYPFNGGTNLEYISSAPIDTSDFTHLSILGDGYREIVAFDKDGIAFVEEALQPGRYKVTSGKMVADVFTALTKDINLAVNDQGVPIIPFGYLFYSQLRTLQHSRTGNQKKSEQYDLTLSMVEPVFTAIKGMAKKYKTKEAFLTEITLEPSQDPSEDEKDKLILTTIHSAKGLEFEVVFVISSSNKRFPRDPYDNEELDEERRCFYVATTRAKKYLYITYFTKPPFQKSWGNDELEPSVFLVESPNMSDTYTIENKTKSKREYNNDGYFADDSYYDW